MLYNVIGVMRKAEEYYKAFVTSSNIVSEFSIPAEHSIVSERICANKRSEISAEQQLILIRIFIIVGYG